MAMPNLHTGPHNLFAEVVPTVFLPAHVEAQQSINTMCPRIAHKVLPLRGGQSRNLPCGLILRQHPSIVH